MEAVGKLGGFVRSRTVQVGSGVVLAITTLAALMGAASAVGSQDSDAVSTATAYTATFKDTTLAILPVVFGAAAAVALVIFGFRMAKRWVLH